MQRNNPINSMDPLTAMADDKAISGMLMALEMPINAETKWPPINDHGVEYELPGFIKTIIADAPMEAAITGDCQDGNKQRVMNATR